MLDIKVTAAGGFADAAAQDKFCSGSSCVFWTIYDQSPKGNHLGVAPAGGAHRQTDKPAPANAGPLTVGGHKVYGLRMDPPSGYRRDNTTDIAVDDEAETMYAVFNGSHYNNRCCFDYGNAETNNHDDGAGTMEAVYFGSAKGGLNHGGAGKGPWIMADMENALWGADRVVSNEEPINHDFVTGKRSRSPLASSSWSLTKLLHSHGQGRLRSRARPLGHQGRRRPDRHPQDLLGRPPRASLRPDEEAGRDHSGDWR